MSYQVLARKWRPRSFSEMVGQEHVLKALVNGLDNGRLHHAYLFTGTRGVGKTTLARIIAKCLNCERGISSTPCGECGACKAIAEGRFVDLLEVDAASRTKVEDTREMLDNVQYLPTSGRYKVYLIDEVHMLSTHSFNALLKTLEEPPPHVKFLLATTDPQKLPVTILSRCLQFNLKNLGPERIVDHLKFVLAEEKVPFEEEALWALGRAADGSMRDALSLTDQAIAHGDGQVTQLEVSAMLGTIDRDGVVEICEAIAGGDAATAMAGVQKLADHAPDYSDALAEMLSFWHRIAIAQTAPDALDHSRADHHRVLQLAAQLDRETVQLFYQITLLGRRDLPHAADPRSGFEMVLLRLLAFHPVMPESASDRPVPPPAVRAREGEAAAKKPEYAPSAGTSAGAASPVAATTEAGRPAGGSRVASVRAEQAQPEPEQAEPQAPVSEPAPQPAAVPERPAKPATPHLSLVKADPAPPAAPAVDDDRPPWDEYETLVEVVPTGNTAEHPDTAAGPLGSSLSGAPQDAAPGAAHSDEAPAALSSQERPPAVSLPALAPDRWLDVYLGLEVGGLMQSIAANLFLDGVDGRRLALTLDRGNSSLYREEHLPRLAELFSSYFGEPVQLAITVGEPAGETPWQILQRRRAERLQQAVESLRHDPLIRVLIEHTGGELVEHSVRPVD